MARAGRKQKTTCAAQRTMLAAQLLKLYEHKRTFYQTMLLVGIKISPVKAPKRQVFN